LRFHIELNYTHHVHTSVVQIIFNLQFLNLSTLVGIFNRILYSCEFPIPVGLLIVVQLISNFWWSWDTNIESPLVCMMKFLSFQQHFLRIGSNTHRLRHMKHENPVVKLLELHLADQSSFLYSREYSSIISMYLVDLSIKLTLHCAIRLVLFFYVICPIYILQCHAIRISNRE